MFPSGLITLSQGVQGLVSGRHLGNLIVGKAHDAESHERHLTGVALKSGKTASRERLQRV